MSVSNLVVNALIGRWCPDKAIVEIIYPSDTCKLFQTMGFSHGSVTYFNVEEAVYCVERSGMELLINDVPASIQEAYSLLSQDGISFDTYAVYCELRSNGYIVFRSQRVSYSHNLLSVSNLHEIFNFFFYIWAPSGEYNFRKSEILVPDCCVVVTKTKQVPSSDIINILYNIFPKVKFAIVSFHRSVLFFDIAPYQIPEVSSYIDSKNTINNQHSRNQKK